MNRKDYSQNYGLPSDGTLNSKSHQQQSSPKQTITIVNDEKNNERKQSDRIVSIDDTPNNKTPTTASLMLTSNVDNNNSISINNRRNNLIHSVSIVVEPAINADNDGDENSSDYQFNDDELRTIPPLIGAERRKTIAGPISMFEDFYLDQPKKAKEYDDIVQSLFASARLRKEEFARLLEEHDQLVKEINKAEFNR
ncbi:hypothetical protein SSS_01125 [Sarcoptes scabiei]|uniref:Uncharacterized protein n=1 Tax=Sarcoptes scabiei TaxID=52283 RepID=A0A834VBZ0_SARSC|nr:hypothetical protein SSS_01125 [Sarcoptes scabiei]